MQLDKDELKKEIEIKSAANRDEINKDVRRQIRDMEVKRMEDRQVDLTFKKKFNEVGQLCTAFSFYHQPSRHECYCKGGGGGTWCTVGLNN